MGRPLIRGPALAEEIGLVSASTAGTVLTADATPGTDGAWTELKSALSRPADRHRLVIYPGGVTGDALVQVGIGAGGSEIVLYTVPMCRNGGSNAPVVLRMPLAIPKNARVAARVYRSTAASWDCEMKMVAEQGGAGDEAPWQYCDTYGVDAANARGTVVDPGGTANTEGSVTSLGTLTRGVRQLIVTPAFYGSSTWTTFNYWHWMRVYHRKAAGTWKQIGGPLFTMAHNAMDNLIVQGQPILNVDLPKDTEIGMTDQCQNGTAGRRNLSVIIQAGS